MDKMGVEKEDILLFFPRMNHTYVQKVYVKKEFKLDLLETWTSKKSMVILCLYHAMPTLQKK